MSTLTVDPSTFLPPRATRAPAARAAATPAQRAWLKPMALDRGEIVRVRDGRGLVIRAILGTVWITEEGEAGDVVLGPGEAHRVASAGVTLVEAHRVSRIVIEAIAGAPAPRGIERVPRPAPAARAATAGEGLRLAGVLAAIAAWFAPRAGSPRVPVGGWESHDKLLSSRRTRGERGARDGFARPDTFHPYY